MGWAVLFQTTFTQKPFANKVKIGHVNAIPNQKKMFNQS